MDAPDRSSSPRSRQLQGPRPPRLAVSKDSHKVRKPPIAPQRHSLQQYHHQQHHQHHQQQPQHQQQAPRAPVIIYDASPKVIHTKPGDFLALVQRLTGPTGGASSAAAQQAQFDAAGAGPSSSAAPPQQQQPPPPEFQLREFLLSPTAALSPAARLAAIERSVRPLPPPPTSSSYAYYVPEPYDDDSAMAVDGFAAAVLGPSAAAAARPGILSPAALPPATSTGLFSPLPFDPTWLADLSPFLASATARAAPGLEPQFAPSPRSNLLATPTMPSPATTSVLEFFSNFPDF